MRVSTIATGFLLPLLALADSTSDTTTLTSTATLTKTITVSEVVASVTSTYTAGNSASTGNSTSTWTSTYVSTATNVATTTYAAPVSVGTASKVSGTGAGTPGATLAPLVNNNGAMGLNGVFAGSAGVLVMVAAALL